MSSISIWFQDDEDDDDDGNDADGGVNSHFDVADDEDKPIFWAGATGTVGVPVSQICCIISIFSIFVSVQVMSKSIVYTSFWQYQQAEICGMSCLMMTKQFWRSDDACCGHVDENIYDEEKGFTLGLTVGIDPSTPVRLLSAILEKI